MIGEYERVVLTANLPEEGLEAGDVGTVVFVHNIGEAYEVEFVTLSGATAAVAAVPAQLVRPVNQTDMVHTRQFAA